MQESLTSVPSEQWSWILSVVWSWIWAGLSWILELQTLVFGFIFHSESAWLTVLKVALLLLPAVALIAAVWGSMASLYTVPFRSGRGAFLAAVLMSWWDALRMTWFYWAGLARFTLILVGWVWSLLKLFVTLTWGALKGAAASPFAVLDWTSRRYFQPGVPWIAFLLVLFWSAVEATIFTFTLRPTMSELLADMTGYELNQPMLTALLWLFLFPLISGSFACIQVLTDAVKSRQIGQVIAMSLVELVVAFFEVLFLYRELVDAITPWLAQQGLTLGIGGTLAVAFLGWVGVRGMTWFLFGRYGTPALLAVLSRQTITREGAVVEVERGREPNFWKGPITALKAEAQWFKQEAREVFELLSLPVLQLVAVAFNFGVVLILGRPYFSLPFRSLEDVMSETPFVDPTRGVEVAAP